MSASRSGKISSDSVENFVLSFLGLASIRLVIRLYREKQGNSTTFSSIKTMQVGIVGAGHSGANLAKELFVRKELRLHPKYFFDDNADKRKSQLHGIPILGKPENQSSFYLCIFPTNK